MPKVWVVFVYACLCWASLCNAGCGTFTAADGTKYLLDPLSRALDYSGKEAAASFSYWFNFCQNIDKAKTGTTCANPTPVAQITDAGVCQAVGYLPPAISELPNKGGIQIQYTNNNDLCGNPKTAPQPGLCQYKFSINTKHACAGGAPKPKGDVDGMSGGSIFLIIFFAALAAYFLIGVVVKWRVYSATGVELVPNTEIWLGLPGLIRDGCLFVKNKLTGAVGYSSL